MKTEGTTGMNNSHNTVNVKEAQGYALFPLLPSLDRTRAMNGATQGTFSQALRQFVGTETWTYAKTMPTWPHEYIVRDRVDETLFVELVSHIRTHGYEGRFYKRPITYYDEAGLTYWTMGSPIDETTIINRCPKENTFEAREKAGTLPESEKKE
jgi:hypothetical protein